MKYLTLRTDAHLPDLHDALLEAGLIDAGAIVEGSRNGLRLTLPDTADDAAIRAAINNHNGGRSAAVRQKSAQMRAAAAQALAADLARLRAFAAQATPQQIRDFT